MSTKGTISPVQFDEAVLQGFAADGGLFVPEYIPSVSLNQLEQWADYDYVELAEAVLSAYIDPSIIPHIELKELLNKSFLEFEAAERIPVIPLGDDNIYMMELFHGPTLSFKDVAMGFLIQVMDYFLEKRGERLSLVLATTGDTGPAAAHASVGKNTIDCWPLYPLGMISDEQRRQMTTLAASNVHPVGVKNCANGGDDLDGVVSRLFGDSERKERLRLSSVNSINWCRVLVQTVHYFHAYLRVVDQIGEKVVFSVPTGAFGNLFAGYLARSMGLPVARFICATNTNTTLHRLFSQGVFAKSSLKQNLSSAIDIVIPYNIWRFLYVNCNCDSSIINLMMEEFASSGTVTLDKQVWQAIQNGYTSAAITDLETLATIKNCYCSHNGYLLDPHGAVALKAIEKVKNQIPRDIKIVCLATAHPAKFPEVTRAALKLDDELPESAQHRSLCKAQNMAEQQTICELSELEELLVEQMTGVGR